MLPPPHPSRTALAPRTWNSLSARCIFCVAILKVGAEAITLASMLS